LFQRALRAVLATDTAASAVRKNTYAARNILKYSTINICLTPLTGIAGASVSIPFGNVATIIET